MMPHRSYPMYSPIANTLMNQHKEERVPENYQKLNDFINIHLRLRSKGKAVQYRTWRFHIKHYRLRYFARFFNVQVPNTYSF